MKEQTETTSRFWRILQFPVTRVVLAFICVIVAVRVARLAVQLLPAQESIPIILLSTGVVVVVAYLSYYAFVRVVEKRPVAELAASGAVGELTVGILVGALLFTATIGILWALGYYRVSGTNDWTIIVPILGAAVTTGVYEEILFRGILFRVIEESLGTWLALMMAAFFFGFSHLFNPNATVVAAIAIALEAGILLSAAYVLTRRLWLAIGIHIAWNLVQGGIFSVAVSGYERQGLLQATLSGPNILSGGEFGAEASVFAVAVCLAAGFCFVWRALRRGNFVKPFWKR